HAVPVRIERSGIRSVLFGNGTGRSPELRFTAPSTDIKIGDRLLTSGIDGTYPAGLAVAEVIDIDRDTGQMFARIACKPLAGIDRSQFLLVLGREAAMPPRPEEPAEMESAKKGRRGRRRDALRPARARLCSTCLCSRLFSAPSPAFSPVAAGRASCGAAGLVRRDRAACAYCRRRAAAAVDLRGAAGRRCAALAAIVGI